MNLLAVDTSGLGCSVAVTTEDRLLAELNLRNNETNSKHLMSIIESLLRIAGMKLSELDAFVVSRGPGSFTGLRIGLSTVKGLALSLGKPLVGVSSLDALAQGAVHMGQKNICAMIDARKDEVFTALYTADGPLLRKISEERLVGLADLARDIDEETLFVGSGAERYRDLIRERAGQLAVFQDDSFNHVRAEMVASLGFKEMARSATLDLSDISASYIRKSDAEIHRDIHEGKTAKV